MRPIPDGMRRILAQMRIKEHPDDYSIVYIDPVDERKARELLRDLRPYSSITYTQDEVSVVVRSSDWAGLRGSFPRHKEEEPYRLITFDVVLDLSIVGFLSVVSTALAEAGVSVYALSTFMKDHILVKKSDAQTTARILNGLVEDAEHG